MLYPIELQARMRFPDWKRKKNLSISGGLGKQKVAAESGAQQKVAHQ